MSLSGGRRFVLSVLFISAGTILLASAGMAQTRTIKNISPRAHGAPGGSSLADIANSIDRAGSEFGWHQVASGDGFVDLSIVVRTHTATVRVGFDDRFFWIDYLNSINLKYSPNDLEPSRAAASRRVRVKGPRIHRNYNRWVDTLAARIAARVSHPARQARPATEQPGVLLVADELEKLDGLRQRGVLTDDEFERQKKRLLGD
jgi:hypothetical protein